MLTLTRKVGESIRIGDDIQIVVKEIRKNQVRIGIVAPRDVKIFREEVYQNIVSENRASAQAGPQALDALNLDLDLNKNKASVELNARKTPPPRTQGGTTSNGGRGDS